MEAGYLSAWSTFHPGEGRMEESQLLSHRRRLQTLQCAGQCDRERPAAGHYYSLPCLRRPRSNSLWAFSAADREMAPSQPSGFAPDAGPTVQRFDAHHARKISGWDEARSPKGVAKAIILEDGNSRPPGQHTASLRYQAAGEEMAPRSSPVGRIRGLRYALLVVGVAPCTGAGGAAVGLARRRRLAVKGERHARTDTANGAEA
jgi:hypothetical protein